MKPAIRAAVGVLAALGTAALAFAPLLRYAEASVDEDPPAIPEPRAAFVDMLPDTRPVCLTVTESWEKVPIVVEAEDLIRDPTLWNRMHFDDWDKVPVPLRVVGVERMAVRYRAAVSGPRVWQAMTPEDWDDVPQPVRAMAFARMAAYFTEQRGVGVRAGLPPRLVADTLAAILMVESWFEHRATNVDVAGNRDLGLPQASDFFRASLERQHRRGDLDLQLEERDYFNPWKVIEAGAVWFELMLSEAGGDLDLAVRAYRKGIAAARQGAAQDYLENVKRKRERYIRNHGAPPTWDLLSRRLRATPGRASRRARSSHEASESARGRTESTRAYRRLRDATQPPTSDDATRPCLLGRRPAGCAVWRKHATCEEA